MRFLKTPDTISSEMFTSDILTSDILPLTLLPLTSDICTPIHTIYSILTPTPNGKLGGGGIGEGERKQVSETPCKHPPPPEKILCTPLMARVVLQVRIIDDSEGM